MASEVRTEAAAEVADVFITGEVLQSNTIDYPQGFVIKPSENQTVYLEFQGFNLKCTELIVNDERAMYLNLPFLNRNYTNAYQRAMLLMGKAASMLGTVANDGN